MPRVKFVARRQHAVRSQQASDAPLWWRQLPDAAPVWGDCTFVFDVEARDYDWLVVYDDLPAQAGQRFSLRVEELACPPAQTIFITAEPTSIKTYGQDFLRQFGIVISSLEPWATPPERTLHSQPGLRWYYGAPYSWEHNPHQLRTLDQLRAEPPQKTALISTVCSNKTMEKTLHGQRVAFTWALKELIPELEIYGHGVRAMDDKAEAITPYKYHLAIENHICPHHFTDKLSDPLLGWALPFYIGAPNAADYIPRDSFIPLDITDVAGAARLIKEAIARDAYSERLSALTTARQRILEEHNLFALIARTIASHPPTQVKSKGKLYSRRALLRHAPLAALRFGLEKLWS